MLSPQARLACGDFHLIPESHAPDKNPIPAGKSTGRISLNYPRRYFHGKAGR